jgi:hypothetical protein
MACSYKTICPFSKGKIPIHEAMFKTNVAKYCNGESASCAIYQIIEKKSFLAIPPDLYPNQTFRVAKVLAQK